MIVDFVELSSDEEEAEVDSEDHGVHGQGRSVQLKEEIVELTSEEDIYEGGHNAPVQGDAAQNTTLHKQEFIADDGQGDASQCTITSQRQELIADDGQGDAAQCTITSQRQELTADDRQGDASQCTTGSQRQELTADDGQGDASQCTTASQRLELIAGDEQGDSSQCTASQRQELIAGDGQSDSSQCTTTSQWQELIADDGHAESAQCTTTIQRQEPIADDGDGDAAQCTTTLQRLKSSVDDGQGDAAQCATRLQRQESVVDNGQGDAAQCTLQGQESMVDDGLGDVAHCTTTPRMQESIADDGQRDVAHCTTTLRRQESITAHGQGNAVQCTTTFRRQDSIANDGQCGVTHCRTTLQRQESITSHGQGNADQCTTTLHRQEFLGAGHIMQEAMLSENAAEATTSLSKIQQWGYRTAAFLNSPPAPTAAPFPRQFWKVGQYTLAAQAASHNGQNRLRIHPKFLHSNATSHKWAFGAIAELLDNAVDEMHNGATFVKIDKMKHAPDGDYSLVIQDDGGGMSPESLRRCMSFRFSQKSTTTSIGQYGNGFKTSTMRLGADVIVFSCRQDKDNRRLTRSVGLLSYTFLMRTGCNDILVPVVDYEFDASSSTFKRIMNYGEKHFSSNLSALLKWSPFSTEDELLNQFSGMECHGTKIIIFNLWLNDACEMELDFITDQEDIMISGASAIQAGRSAIQMLKQMHVASRFHYSLRVYASILYLHLPENFQIILCGRAVEPHHIINDLIYLECIRYRPQVEEIMEVDVITTIGFLRGAPKLDIYGFNVYHKNRLILPFWPAGSYKNKRRGIAGVLETNFIRPTHDKQDFEKTGLFNRLETRLKDMATEYWTHHCHLVGYAPIAKRVPPSYYVSTAADNNDVNLAPQATRNNHTYDARGRARLHPCSSGESLRNPLHVGTLTDQMDCNACPLTSINAGTAQTEVRKRRHSSSVIYWRAQKRRTINDCANQSSDVVEMAEEGCRVIIDQNAMLKSECSELEAAGQQLKTKVDKLRKELDMWRRMYQGYTDELRFYDDLNELRRSRPGNNSSLGYYGCGT